MKHLLILLLFITGSHISSAQKPTYISWSFITGDRIYSHPIVDQNMVYFGSNDDHFYAVDVNSGELVWKFNTGFNVQSSCLINEDLVWFESGNVFYALDKNSGKELWKYETGQQSGMELFDPWDYHRPAPVADRNNVYFPSSEGTLFAFDKESYDLMWRYTTIDSAAIRSTPVIDDQVTYFGDWNGRIYALDVGLKSPDWILKTYEEQLYPTFGQLNTKMVIYESLLLFGARNPEIAGLDSFHGDPMWDFEVENGGWISGDPVVEDGIMYIGGSDCHKLFAIDVNSGELIWEHVFSYNNFSQPMICGEYLVFTTGNAYANEGNNWGQGYLYAVNKTDGSIKNFALVGGNLFTSPVTSRGKIFVGSDDNRLYAIDSLAFLTTELNIESSGYNAVNPIAILPKPFKDNVNIVYDVNYTAKISIRIFDYYGEEVKILFKGKKEKGEYTITWDGKDQLDNDVPAGAYFLRIGSGEYFKSGIILKQQ